MLRLFTERGGDPDRGGQERRTGRIDVARASPRLRPAGRRHSVYGRPGWHVECTAIALSRIGTALTSRAAAAI